jgi:signal transduction histidine kinase/ActR/RegA family two-component response regulator
MRAHVNVRSLAVAALFALAALVVDHAERLPLAAIVAAAAVVGVALLGLLRSLAHAGGANRALELERDSALAASDAKSMFVATVSHELRTPLAGVIGMTELLLDTPLGTEQREYAEIVRSSGEGLLLVVNDILDHAKIEAGRLELDERSFALRETLAEGCAALLVLARNKRIAFDVVADRNLPQWVVGDAPRLRQILINLVSNAVKFTAEGGVSVRIEVAPRALLDPADCVRVRVEVADTGIGIDRQTLARVFQPFAQAERSTARTHGGTGLGLTIAARLVAMMGGSIGASSDPGAGSRFWFEVPLVRVDAATSTAPCAPDVFRIAGPGRRRAVKDTAPVVLVVEDNPVNQLLAARLLEKCGYRSEIVGNGREAVEAVQQQGDFAAVLMDCEMPELDGYAATRAIRRGEGAASRVPVIAMTAHSMTGDREKCIAAGMDDYVGKPIGLDSLSEVLARHTTAATAPRRSEDRD